MCKFCFPRVRGTQRRRMLRLLRAEPAKGTVWQCGDDVFIMPLWHGLDPWYADWHSVQKLKAQLARIHNALFMAESNRAGESQRRHRLNASCPFRDFVA